MSPASICILLTFCLFVFVLQLLTMNPHNKDNKEIVVCTGMTCTRNFAKDIVKQINRLSKVKCKTCTCMGLCTEAPNVKVGRKIYSNVKPEKLNEIIGHDIVPNIKGNPVMDSDVEMDSIQDLLDI